MIQESAAGEEFPSTRSGGCAYEWYRGDCHVHSEISYGGELTSAQLVVAARAAGLDFIAITEHNTAMAHADPSWSLDEDLLVILGQEATTPSGHWLALGLVPGQAVGWDYDVGEEGLIEQLRDVRRVDAVSVVAHPFAPYPSGTFMYPYSEFNVVEVWNGTWTSDVAWQADNEAALSAWTRDLAHDRVQGRWRPAIGNSDTHLAGQIGHPQTVVLAEELSSQAVLAGIRAGRSWIAASSSIELSFVVSVDRQVAGIGERMRSGGDLEARVEVRGVPSGLLSIHTEKGSVYRASLPSTGACTVTWTAAAGAAFVRVEVRDKAGRMAALSNPIFID